MKLLENQAKTTSEDENHPYPNKNSEDKNQNPVNLDLYMKDPARLFNS